MHIIPVKLDLMHPPQDDLLAKIKASSLSLAEGDVVCIASKVVSIWQGRTVLQKDVPDKDALIKREAKHYLPRDLVRGGHVLFTKKENMVIPTAGIDESNAGEYFVLWPKEPSSTAGKIRAWLQNEYGISKLGVIITDSRSQPFRRGVTGFALGWSGLLPLYDHRGKQDLFGKPLAISQTNVVDSLACVAVLLMGEVAEQTPIVRIREYAIKADEEHADAQSDKQDSFIVPPEDDLYAVFYESAPWRHGEES